MENASKALLIAGGVLLAMMILALVVYVASSMGDIAESQDRKKLTEQIEEFNKGYLAYNKTRMYGTDVLTVFNKAKDEKEYRIEIIATDKNGITIPIENNHDFKTAIFECQEEEITYDNETGRISKMVFRNIET